MRVRDVMTPDPLTVTPGDSLSTAKERMAQANCRCLPVVDEAGKVCAIVTDRDLRLAVNSPLVMRERWQDDLLLERTEVAACMTANPVCVAPDVLLERAVDLMLGRKISGMPVVEGDRLVGVITTTDLLRALAQLLRLADQTAP